MRFSRLASVILCSFLGAISISDFAQAQPGRGRGGFGGMFGASSLPLLQDEKVQKELELDEDQLSKFKDLMDEMRNEMRDAFSEMQGGGDREEMMAQVREKISEINKEFDGLVDKELLPNQQKRLKQLVVQSQARMNGGVSSGAIPDSLIKELEITDEQKKQMEEKAKSVREDLQKKIANLTKQAEEEVLSVLTQEQRDKFKEMIGDQFEFSQPNFGAFGRGARGGDGGGRGRGEGGGRGGEGGQSEGGGSRGDRDF